MWRLAPRAPPPTRMPEAPRARSRTPRLNRKLHRIGALVSALPLLVVIASGIFLQLKKDWSWVQPPTRPGSTQELAISWDEIIEAARGVDRAGIRSWSDVDRLDVRPSQGMLKVRSRSRWEVQLDASTAEVLSVEYRRSDLIESIHDGSFFGDPAKRWVFLPAAFVLMGLWISGVYLWLLPHLVRRRRRA